MLLLCPSRYIAIVYPFRPQLQTHHAKWIIAVVWLIGLVVVIPYMLALELKGHNCMEDFEDAGMVTPAFTVGVLVAQYLVPLTIIVVSYIRWVRGVFVAWKQQSSGRLNGINRLVDYYKSWMSYSLSIGDRPLVAK